MQSKWWEMHGLHLSFLEGVGLSLPLTFGLLNGKALLDHIDRMLSQVLTEHRMKQHK